MPEHHKRGWVPGYLPSNGTEGDLFNIGPAGCHSCSVDHDEGWHEGDGRDNAESCPIMMAALLGEAAPTEWEAQRDGLAIKATRCTAWRGPCACTEGTDYTPPPPEWGLPRA
jgi:hypothetical protein